MQSYYYNAVTQGRYQVKMVRTMMLNKVLIKARCCAAMKLFGLLWQFITQLLQLTPKIKDVLPPWFCY